MHNALNRYSSLTYDDESGEHIKNDNYKVGFGTIKLDGTNFYEHFSIEIPPTESEFFDSLKDYLPEADRVNRTDASLMYGVSPNKEWVAINAFHTYNFYTSEEPLYLDGYRVDSIRGIDFLLINSQTKAIHKVGTRHTIEYSGGYLRETGPSYCVVKWTEDDKVYLIEQVKEDKIIRKSQLDNYTNIVNQAQVPFASAKGMVLSLDDFTLTPSDEVVPVTPWVTFVDHTTGVTGYTEFIKFDDGKLAYGFFEPPGTFGESGFSWQSLYVSDSSFTYYLPDLLPPIDEYNLSRCDVISSGYLNNRLQCVIATNYTSSEELSIDSTSCENWEELVPPPIHKLFLLNMSSGKLSELEIEDADLFCNEQKILHCSDPELKKIYICISIKPIDQEWQQCLCTVDDDKIIRPEIQLQRMVEGYLRKAK